ncbi:aminotransferase-like domain-containing protein [Pedobacter sp. NJ-S-72]
MPGHGKYLINDDRIEPIKAFQTSIPSFEHFPFAIWSRIAADIYRNIHLLHLGYDDIQGHLPLREVLADHLRINRSIDCKADQLVIVNGSRQGMHLLAEMFLKKGDQCWMEDPGYASAKCAFERFGGVLCPIPIGNKGLDIDYALKNYPSAKIAYVTPSHQYPLGITMPPLAERIRLLQHAKKKGMLIIEDDYDSEFRYNGRPLPALRGLDNSGHVIYLGTFSKILFPALRIGYVVMPTAEMARQLSFIKMITDRQNPGIDQAILCEFIRSGHFARHLRRMRLLYKKNQDYLVFLLKKYLGDHIIINAGDAGMHFVVSFVKDCHAEAVKKQRDSKVLF